MCFCIILSLAVFMFVYVFVWCILIAFIKYYGDVHNNVVQYTGYSQAEYGQFTHNSPYQIIIFSMYM